MTTEEIKAAAAELETASAAEILRWAADRFAARLTLATSLGVEDCVVTDLIARAGLPVQLFTLDTGLLFPESDALWKQIEERYGIAIQPVKPEFSVAEQAEREGDALWE